MADYVVPSEWRDPKHLGNFLYEIGCLKKAAFDAEPCLDSDPYPCRGCLLNSIIATLMDDKIAAQFQRITPYRTALLEMINSYLPEPESTPCRLGMPHAKPCKPLGDGFECACGCAGDDSYCLAPDPERQREEAV